MHYLSLRVMLIQTMKSVRTYAIFSLTMIGI